MEQVNLWEEIGLVFGEMLHRILLWTKQAVANHAPGFLSALLVVALGWFAAALLRNVASKLLRAVGLDVVAERTGLRDYMRRHEIGLAPSMIVGRALFFVVIFTALMMAVDRLEFSTAAQWMHAVANFLPRLLVVLVLLMLGAWAARWLGALIGRAARLGGVPFHTLVGVAVRVGVMVMAMIVALDFLGLAASKTLLVGLGIILATAMVLTGLFALCARELVGNMLARHFVLSEYKPGDHIRLGDIDGVVESIGPTVMRVRRESGLSLVPLGRVLRETVEVVGTAEGGRR
jgi:small-conductance mechanosensitive channel